MCSRILVKAVVTVTHGQSRGVDVVLVTAHSQGKMASDETGDLRANTCPFGLVVTRDDLLAQQLAKPQHAHLRWSHTVV